jgi:hypothetical protein
VLTSNNRQASKTLEKSEKTPKGKNGVRPRLLRFIHSDNPASIILIALPPKILHHAEFIMFILRTGRLA